MKTRLARLALIAATGFGVWAMPQKAPAQVYDPGQYGVVDARNQLSAAQANYDAACAALKQAQADCNAARQNADDLASALSQQQQTISSLQDQLGQAQAALPGLEANLQQAQQRAAIESAAVADVRRRLDAAQAAYQSACDEVTAQMQSRPDFAAAQATLQAVQQNLDAAVQDAIRTFSSTPEYRQAYNQWQGADRYSQSIRAGGRDQRQIDAATNAAIAAKGRLDNLVNADLENNGRVRVVRQQLANAQAQLAQFQPGGQIDQLPEVAPVALQRASAQRGLDQAQSMFQAAQSEAAAEQNARDQAAAAVSNLSGQIAAAGDHANQLGAQFSAAQADVANRQEAVRQCGAAADGARYARDQAASILNERLAALPPAYPAVVTPAPVPAYPVYPAYSVYPSYVPSYTGPTFYLDYGWTNRGYRYVPNFGLHRGQRAVPVAPNHRR